MFGCGSGAAHTQRRAIAQGSHIVLAVDFGYAYVKEYVMRESSLRTYTSESRKRTTNSSLHVGAGRQKKNVKSKWGFDVDVKVGFSSSSSREHEETFEGTNGRINEWLAGKCEREVNEWLPDAWQHGSLDAMRRCTALEGSVKLGNSNPSVKNPFYPIFNLLTPENFPHDRDILGRKDALYEVRLAAVVSGPLHPPR